MEQQMRDLIEAAIKYLDQSVPSTVGYKLDYLTAIANAQSALEHSGWHKWPEEKPSERGVYQVYCKPSESGYVHRTDLDWFGFAPIDSEKHWNDMEVVAWQPLPSLPKSEA